MEFWLNKDQVYDAKGSVPVVNYLHMEFWLNKDQVYDDKR
jgi:hypothetical protein